MIEGLRDFLVRELGEGASEAPVGLIVAKCYREFLIRANNGQKGKIPASLVQEKLCQIAGEFLNKGMKGGR
jgi:hypothetical protein